MEVGSLGVGSRPPLDFVVGVVYKVRHAVPSPSARVRRLAFLAAPASAQLLTVDHPGQYTQEDIGRGGLVLQRQLFSVSRPRRRPDSASTCGAVSFVDRSPMKTWRRRSREALRAACRRSSSIRPSSPRSSPSSAPDSTRARREGGRAAGARSLPGQGRVRDVPPRGWHGPAIGARPERHRDCARASRARTRRSAILAALLPINRPVRIVMRDGRTSAAAD